MLAGIGPLVARWARLYADHKAMSGGVTYLHLAGILVAGGFAVSADRAALRWSPAAGSVELQNAFTVHRWVITGLCLTLVSGVGMLLADLDTYLSSAVFWTKMGLVALLIANGYLKLRAEAGLRDGGVSAWPWLRRTAIASIVLWFAVLLAGTVLTAST
ncbi:MAG TPA: hypothetical protein VEU74_06860 [Gemmatimonadales bacterium]|nr:hypothetical protein [Gemmatimonadales bacterium]